MIGEVIYLLTGPVIEVTLGTVTAATTMAEVTEMAHVKAVERGFYPDTERPVRWRGWGANLWVTVPVRIPRPAP